MSMILGIEHINSISITFWKANTTFFINEMFVVDVACERDQPTIGQSSAKVHRHLAVTFLPMA